MGKSDCIKAVSKITDSLEKKRNLQRIVDAAYEYKQYHTMDNDENDKGEHIYHVIKNGSKQTLTNSEMNTIVENNSSNEILIDTDWYFSNGYITAEDFAKNHPI